MESDLPNGISEILEHLATMAKGYNNHLKWNEVAMLKADLMNTRHRWLGVPVSSIKSRCSELGMRAEDTAAIADLITKAQSGRRLVPEKGYRTFQFQPPVDPSPPPRTSWE